jgi:hypothetical protein
VKKYAVLCLLYAYICIIIAHLRFQLPFSIAFVFSSELKNRTFIFICTVVSEAVFVEYCQKNPVMAVKSLFYIIFVLLAYNQYLYYE